MSDLEIIKKLRQSTGAGFKDCNEALKESSGDINKAVEILWTFRNIDLSNVSKFTTPVDYLTLNDGRQVLVLNDTIYNFLKSNSIIDS